MTQFIPTSVISRFKIVSRRSVTTSKFFKDIQLGDVVEVSVELRQSYGNMPKATVANLRTGEIRTDVISRIGDGLRHFIAEEVTE